MPRIYRFHNKSMARWFIISPNHWFLTDQIENISCLSRILKIQSNLNSWFTTKFWSFSLRSCIEVRRRSLTYKIPNLFIFTIELNKCSSLHQHPILHLFIYFVLPKKSIRMFLYSYRWMYTKKSADIDGNSRTSRLVLEAQFDSVTQRCLKIAIHILKRVKK